MPFFVYLVFHRNRLAAIERSSKDPDEFLAEWLSKKDLAHLFYEFQVGVWDKSIDDRGGIYVFSKPYTDPGLVERGVIKLE